MPRKANPYIRVTDVCSFINGSWWQYWAKSVGIAECERISLESTEFGKAVHKVIENHLIATPIPELTTERQLFCGKLMVDWCKQTNFKPLMIEGKPCIEYTLTSEKYMFRGHPDVIGTFGDDPRPWVVDWKTSKECRLEYILQKAAYAYALGEQCGIECNDGTVVRTPSDPNVMPQFETHPFNNLKEVYFPIFLEGLHIVEFFKKRGKWKEILKGV